MSADGDAPPEKKKRRRGRKRLAALALFIAGAVWLNGPGWRWIGGIVARKALEGSGLTTEFELKGTLLGGIKIEKLAVRGGPIRKLEIDSVDPRYQLKKIIRGDLDGLAVEKLDLVIDLAADPLPSRGKRREEKVDLSTTMKKVRSILVPLDLTAAGLRIQVVRGEENVAVLDSSDFSHAPGSEEFVLKFGELTIGAGYAFAAQESVIVWEEERLSLDRFDVTPSLGIRDVRVDIPASGRLAASGLVQVEDSRIQLASDRSSATVKLEGEPLVVQEALKNFALEIPAGATVRRLEIAAQGLDLTPDQWNATASVEIGGLRYEGWQAETLALDATKTGNQGTLNASLAALGTTLTGNASLRWRDLAAGQWADFEATAKASVPQVTPLFATLKEKYHIAPKDAPPLPPSSLNLDATIDSAPDGIRSLAAEWLLSPENNVAASLAGEATWTPPDGKIAGTLASEGHRGVFALDLTEKRYQGSAVLEGFRPERIGAWAATFGVTLPPGMNASGTWQGSGDFAPQPHRGSFDITSFEWVRKDTPPLIIRTKGNYSWPREVVLEQLTAITEGQTINASASFANQVLKIPRLEWKDGDTRLVGGQAEIPIPKEMKTIRDFLKQDMPLNVFLESEWIDHARLAAWLPEKKSPLATGSGRVRLVVTGTPAAPKVDLDLDLKGVSLPDQPDVPVTDATITLDGADGILSLNGQIKPTGYAPVVVTGKTAFKPGEWAEDPDSMLDEKIEARANIPRLDLATFSKFVPKAEKLAGTVEGHFTASGTIGKPDLGGELRLSGGAFSLKDSQAPPVSNANALVRLQGKEVRLQSLSLESAGGTLTGNGVVGLADAKKPTFDLTLRGTALPLKRDEAMIVRADANLVLRGDLQQANISGTVDIVDSLYYRDFEILPVRVPFTAPKRPNLPAIDPEEKAAALPEPFSNWTLDVMARARDPILIRGNLATGSIVARVHFGGTLGHVQPDGHAIISDAEARLPFSTLKVDSGAVVFTPDGGLNPELNIRGTSSIGRYEVSVFFYGPVDAPKTALTSDPPLPESEIMTLLATGTTSEGLEDGQAATLKAAQLLIEEWRRGRLPYAEQVAKVLEVLNRVDVRIGEDDPLTGRRLNSATIEVTDKIFISGSVDKQSNTRVLGAFVLRFK